MKFEKEKQFVINALEGGHSLKGDSFCQELDRLHGLFMHCVHAGLDKATGNAMFLALYLSTRHACHSVHILKAVSKDLIVDPFGLPYKEYADKFRKFLEDLSYAWYAHTACNCTMPTFLDDSEDWDSIYDEYERNFGVKQEALFPDVETDKDCFLPDDTSGELNQAMNILHAHESYLLHAIEDGLKELVDTLESIDRMMDENKCYSWVQEDLFRKRIDTYLDGPKWADDKKELFHEIKMLSSMGPEDQALMHLSFDTYSALKRNRLGALYLRNEATYLPRLELLGYSHPLTQAELNEYLRLRCRYDLISKLVKYGKEWAVPDADALFVNRGTKDIVESLVPFLAEKAQLGPRYRYAALREALEDLGLLTSMDAEVFKNWVNDSFLKDAPIGRGKNEKMELSKSIKQAVEDLYKFQTKEGIQKRFKNLTEEEIAQLKSGNKLKEAYQKCVLILAKTFGLDLAERNFQPYITGFDTEELFQDFPETEENAQKLEYFKAYQAYLQYKLSPEHIDGQ